MRVSGHFKLKTRLCFVYVIGTICSKDKRRMSTYVGWTNDLENRLILHNTGKGAKYTRGRKWIILYVESHLTRGKAMSREWQLKRDRKFRSNILNNLKAYLK